MTTSQNQYANQQAQGGGGQMDPNLANQQAMMQQMQQQMQRQQGMGQPLQPQAAQPTQAGWSTPQGQQPQFDAGRMNQMAMQQAQMGGMGQPGRMGRMPPQPFSMGIKGPGGQGFPGMPQGSAIGDGHMGGGMRPGMLPGQQGGMGMPGGMGQQMAMAGQSQGQFAMPGQGAAQDPGQSQQGLMQAMLAQRQQGMGRAPNPQTPPSMALPGMAQPPQPAMRMPPRGPMNSV